MVRRPKIDAGWTWPGPVTLSGPIGATLEVVGESHYQAELMRVGGGKTESGPVRPRVIAELVREPRNRHDRNAVAVQVGGSTVGYIAREDAPRVGHVVDHMWNHGYPATVAATIIGGWDRGGGNVGSFGIRRSGTRRRILVFHRSGRSRCRVRSTSRSGWSVCWSRVRRWAGWRRVRVRGGRARILRCW